MPTSRGDGDETSESLEGETKCSQALLRWQSLCSPSNSRQNSSDFMSRPCWPRPRAYAAMALHGRFLFLHGGQSTIEPSGEAEHYMDLMRLDLTTNLWTTCHPASIERFAHSMHCVEFKGRHYLLVFGGFDPKGLRPELYDLQLERWLVGKGSLFVYERRFCASTVDFGGAAASTSSDTVMLDVPLAAEEVLRKPQQQQPRWHRYLVESGSSAAAAHTRPGNFANRYLHSSICVKRPGSTGSTMYVFGGTSQREGAPLADLTVVELSDDDGAAAAIAVAGACGGGDIGGGAIEQLHVELFRPQCTGQEPCARLGHRACALGNEAMLIYGGVHPSLVANGSEDKCVRGTFDGDAQVDLYILYRLDLSTFVWTTVDVNSYPPQRMLFGMVSDRTNTRIVLFSGREPPLECGDDIIDEAEPLEAYLGRITADMADPSRPTELRYSVEWRHVLCHDGPYPKDISAFAFAVASPEAAMDGALLPGVHCYVLGGENSDGICVPNLVELTISTQDLEKDSIASEGGGSHDDDDDDDEADDDIMDGDDGDDSSVAEEGSSMYDSAASLTDDADRPNDLRGGSARDEPVATPSARPAHPSVVRIESSDDAATSSGASADDGRAVPLSSTALRRHQPSDTRRDGQSVADGGIATALGQSYNTEDSNARSLGSNTSASHRTPPSGRRDDRREAHAASSPMDSRGVGRGGAVASPSLSSPPTAHPSLHTNHAVLQIVADSLATLHQAVIAGFDDVRSRIDQTNRRIDAVESAMRQHFNVPPVEQRLVNEHFSQSLSRISKALGI